MKKHIKLATIDIEYICYNDDDEFDGFVGSAEIDGKTFMGYFPPIETYDIQGKEIVINWSDYVE
jgi:hypothetical protein